MESLIMEHKYDNFIEYDRICTPCPSVLKPDCKWRAQVLEDLDCPYCREHNAIDIVDGDEFWIYVNPRDRKLHFTNYDGIGMTTINYCPMCGRHL